jgi:ubiquinone/menaquinone biosynthesis C-methylase UbiE
VESTGERLIPSQQGDAAIEHLHRYAVAAEIARGKAVLDLACGEGYGAFLMSRAAVRVVGVDVSSEAVAHATATYGSDHLQYVVGSCTAVPLADDSVDLVVSFETLEHVQNHDAMLDEIRRVLRPDGLLILSTPDRDVYTREQQRDNPFHVRELSLHELSEVVARRFRCRRFYRQRLVRGSLVLEQEGDEWPGQQPGFSTLHGDFSQTAAERGLARSVYLIVLASDAPITATASSYFESATVHDDLVKELALARGRLLELEEKLDETRRALFAAQSDLEEARRALPDTRATPGSPPPGSRLRHWAKGALFLRPARAMHLGAGPGVNDTRLSLRSGRAHPPGPRERDLQSKVSGSMVDPRPESDPQIEGPETRCAALEKRLAMTLEEARNVRRSLELQKIILVQERDDLYRQRQALIAECGTLRSRMTLIEVGRPAAVPTMPGLVSRLRLRVRAPLFR